jgi:hypothetical protein
LLETAEIVVDVEMLAAVRGRNAGLRALQASLLVFAILAVIVDRVNPGALLPSAAVTVCAPRLRVGSRLELCLVGAMGVQMAACVLDLFYRVTGFDKAIHFAFAFLAVHAANAALTRAPARMTPLRIAAGGAVLYEVYEALVTNVFGAQMQFGVFDTSSDIFASVFGAWCARALLLRASPPALPTTALVHATASTARSRS